MYTSRTHPRLDERARDLGLDGICARRRRRCQPTPGGLREQNMRGSGCPPRRHTPHHHIVDALSPPPASAAGAAGASGQCPDPDCSQRGGRRRRRLPQQRRWPTEGGEQQQGRQHRLGGSAFCLLIWWDWIGLMNDEIGGKSALTRHTCTQSESHRVGDARRVRGFVSSSSGGPNKQQTRRPSRLAEQGASKQRRDQKAKGPSLVLTFFGARLVGVVGPRSIETVV